MKRTIRELEIHDIDLMVNYFLNADSSFLKSMGVEPSKLPNYHKWQQILREDGERPIKQKHFYYLIWEVDDTPVGHSNLNKIIYGQEAFLHLHLWQSENRSKGNGLYFVQESVPRYFQKFDLQHLFCEPNALNLAPNKTLAKAGFEFIKTYEPTPGWINFPQPVNRWVLTRERWLQLISSK